MDTLAQTVARVRTAVRELVAGRMTSYVACLNDG